jgi:hypothetical protein
MLQPEHWHHHRPYLRPGEAHDSDPPATGRRCNGDNGVIKVQAAKVSSKIIYVQLEISEGVSRTIPYSSIVLNLSRIRSAGGFLRT